MKTDNIQALKDVLAGFSKAETEFDNYIGPVVKCWYFSSGLIVNVIEISYL